MRALCSVVFLLGASAWAAEPSPGVVVRVGPVEAPVSSLDEGLGARDVEDFESFLLVNMARRGVCLSRLGPGFYARLRRVLSEAADAVPARFHYLALLAGRLDDAQITDVFNALRDERRPFARFVEDQVRFFQRPAGSPLASAGGSSAAGHGGAAGSGEIQLSQTLVREYKRYQDHCPMLWVEDAESGPPPARCGYQPWDFQASFSRVMGDAFAPLRP